MVHGDARVGTVNHRDTMEQLATKLGWRRGVELGLGEGLLFARLRALGIDVVGVDLGKRADRRAKVEALGGTVHWTSTREAVALVEDGWADFVFIDAAHSYDAVQEDIALWQAKVKPGGWFGGHDYHVAFPGVMRAVDEAFGRNVIFLPGWIWSRA